MNLMTEMDADNVVFFTVCGAYIFAWLCLELHEWWGNTD